jgi:hypothetical protein
MDTTNLKIFQNALDELNYIKRLKQINSRDNLYLMSPNSNTNTNTKLIKRFNSVINNNIINSNKSIQSIESKNNNYINYTNNNTPINSRKKSGNISK